MAYNRKEHLQQNIDAIRTAFLIEREKRTPTGEEQAVLRGYSGFGGLKCVLYPASALSDSTKWPKSEMPLFTKTMELHKVLRENAQSEQEYKRYVDSLKSSVLTAFYTPGVFVNTLIGSFNYFGVVPQKVLEPSSGIGVFVDAVKQKNKEAYVMAYEKDFMTGKVLKTLHQDSIVRFEGFEKLAKPFEDYFDMAVSNIPFGDIAVFDPAYTNSKELGRRQAAKAVHNYIFLKALDAVHDGGVVAFITSQGVMDSPTSAPIREEMLCHADLVSAVRLPNNLFTENANTEVGSDLVILQKNAAKKELTESDRLFINVEDVDGIGTSSYFVAHGDHVMLRAENGQGKNLYLHLAVLYFVLFTVSALFCDLYIGRILAETAKRTFFLSIFKVELKGKTEPEGVVRVRGRVVVPVGHATAPRAAAPTAPTAHAE